MSNFVPDYYIYTDGACSKNGYAGACAGIGVYFGPNDPRNISKKVIGKQTNNTAELSAIIYAYKQIENDVLTVSVEWPLKRRKDGRQQQVLLVLIMPEQLHGLGNAGGGRLRQRFQVLR